MMNKPNSDKNAPGKQNGVARPKSREFFVEPTLYSSIIQTEWKLRNITNSRLESKPIANKVIIYFVHT